MVQLRIRSQVREWYSHIEAYLQRGLERILVRVLSVGSWSKRDVQLYLMAST